MKKIVPLFLIVLACKPDPPEVSVVKADSGTKVLLQAISIVDEQVAWISGHQSTFIRTTDGGRSWSVFSYPEADSLQFRDIHAFDDKQAVLMTAGPGSLSRIYLYSEERGWQETYRMPFEEGFLNTIEFWDDQLGLAFGDSFNGRLFILRTEDGGAKWKRIDPERLPPANPGEGGFAASGTCIATRPEGWAWIGTGAGGHSRVLRTTDYGETWKWEKSPLVKGEAAGITSIRMAIDEVGTIVGGDLTLTNDYSANTAYTEDAGKTWTLTTFPETTGAFYGSDIIFIRDYYFWIACGPNGIDFSYDLGANWINLDTVNFWAVDMHTSGYGYAAGKNGHLLRIDLGTTDGT